MMQPESRSNQNPQAETDYYTIKYNRQFDTSEASGKFHGEVSNSLRQSGITRINITVERDEQIIVERETKFNLYFSINFISGNGKDYDRTYTKINSFINQVYNNYQSKGMQSPPIDQTYHHDRTSSTVEREPRKSKQTKMNLGSKFTDPAFLTIAAFVIFAIGGMYSVNHYARQNNSNSQPAAIPGRDPVRDR